MATGLSYTTIHRWYWRFRALVPKDSQETPLSGIVEVDESWFGKQRYGHQTIVIGGIERASKRLKLQVIPNTEKSSILPFLQTSIVPDSLVVTDAYSSYRKVASLGYRHEVWNHGEGYFAGTNHIEATWSAMKRYLRKLYGCVPTKRLQLILNEWMARHNNPPLFTSPQAFLQSSLFRIG
jgi:transposase-like protein